MTQSRVDGKAFADKLCKKIQAQVESFKKSYKVVPALAIIRVGDDLASAIYVNNKLRRAKALGISAIEYHMPTQVSAQEILQTIEKLNQDKTVHAIIVQLPLPKHINPHIIINHIAPEKDVDCLGEINAGRLYMGLATLKPCTPSGILLLLKHLLGNDLSGLKAAIIGRSNIVGKPMALMLLAENCTVKILHSKSKNIAEETKEANILISAVGIPSLVKEDWVKKGACVIDVGISKIHSTLYGDVDYENVKSKAKYITPVPGGIGPITVAMLMANTITAALAQVKNQG